jgi:hypothetical protein
MAHEQIDRKAQNQDPSLQGEISLDRDIYRLRQNPAVGCEDLFSSNKMKSNEYPDKPGVRVALHTPIETAGSSRSDVEQDLMAVIALGQDVALGVVRGKDTSDEEISYISLLINNPSDNKDRARLIYVLKNDTPITIGRHSFDEQVAGRAGVSRRHCTIELEDGILTVVDETSTNGTSVFTNITQHRTRQFDSIHTWAQPSTETKQLIESEREAKRLSRALHLGRFIVNS